MFADCLMTAVAMAAEKEQPTFMAYDAKSRDWHWFLADSDGEGGASLIVNPDGTVEDYPDDENELRNALSGVLSVTQGMYVEFVSTEEKLRDAEANAWRVLNRYPPLTPTPPHEGREE